MSIHLRTLHTKAKSSRSQASFIVAAGQSRVSYPAWPAGAAGATFNEEHGMNRGPFLVGEQNGAMRENVL